MLNDEEQAALELVKIEITDRRRKSDADICRENKWNVGTVLEGDEGYGPSRIQITAIGETGILAKKVFPKEDSETNWTLSCRDWKKVGSGIPVKID